MKYIIIVPDGAADKPLRELGNKTPLQVAKKPNMDWLAKNGRCGLFETLPVGLPVGSAIANYSILGYKPYKGIFWGRGALEAKSIGIKLAKNDVAFRCNLIYVEDGRIIDHSAGGTSTKEAKVLIDHLNKKLGSTRVKFHTGLSYRHVLVLKGYSPEVKCAPPQDHLDEKFGKLMAKATSKKGKRTATLLNSLTIKSQELLSSHPINVKRLRKKKNPANSVWFWDQGTVPRIKTLQERFRVRGAAISAVKLIKGLAMFAGMSVINVKGATGSWDTNYAGKASAAIKALKDYDLVYLHIEAPDEAAHKGDAKLKIRTIEDIDKKVIGKILEETKKFKESVTIAVLPDHITPTKERKHVRGRVPFLIYNSKKKGDPVATFDESSVKKGSYGKIKGDDFIKAVLGE